MAKTAGRSGSKWARWALGLAAVGGVAAALALMFAPRPVAVDVGVVARGPIAETVADQGYAQVRDAYLVSAPVAGRLERITLRVGDRVVAGSTPVAKIRPASAELLDPRARARAEALVAVAGAAAVAAEAQQEQLSARARQAQRDAVRQRELFDAQVASRQAMETAQAEAATSAAAARAAGAQLQVRRSELAVARAALLGPEAEGAGVVNVTSPASGHVTRVVEQSERIVQLGAPLVEVSDQSGLEAAIEFLSQDAARIREGMPAEVFDWGGPGVLPAVVRRVEPQAFTKVSALGVEEQRVRVLLQLTGQSSSWTGLAPGYRVWGRVILRRAADASKVPLGALVRQDGDWAAFRIERGRARLTKVRVGAMTDREAEVTAGLSPGDRVVVFPSDRVRDGARVKARQGR